MIQSNKRDSLGTIRYAVNYIINVMHIFEFVKKPFDQAF
jgi:hypothetical protein